MRRFVHRCGCCVYLGCDLDHDYYFCKMGVVVARFGNDPYAAHIGSDIARILFEQDTDRPLAMAYGIAHAMQLVR